MALHPLAGSERTLPAAARVLAPADPSERLEVSVIVRHREPARLRARLAAMIAGDAPPQPLTREAFAAAHGADPADLELVHRFAAAHGLSVAQTHAARRTVVLEGSVRDMSTAFGVQLHRVTHAGRTYRGRTGPVQLPAELVGVVQAVLGLDDRPQARPHHRVWRQRPAAAAAAAYTPPQVAQLYGFPPAGGAGQCVAVVELGGGYRSEDLAAYFAALGVTAPAVVSVSVDHADNAPSGDANGPDGEVMLDVEVIGAIANAATVAVYFAPNTDAGFLDAVTTAIHDTTHRPQILSISWGGPESTWTMQAMQAMDQAFQAAAALGITVCVACGDNGSSDGVGDGAEHVDFPASSPFALACGGTRLEARGSAIAAETVWNDGAGGGATGGGVSRAFPLPDWQRGLTLRTAATAAPLAARGVPDVAGDADPATGYTVRVDGADTVIGGTSAVAPLWAALVARINELNGRPAGYLQPRLYGAPQALRDVVSGNNGDYLAAPGWDACTGLGSPAGAALRKLLQ